MIIEGKIINFDGEQYGQIEINPRSGLIERVGTNLGTPDLKTDGFIFPGFIDLHVHCREDASGEQTFREDFRTASEAAIHGGVVHIADMPNNPIAPVDDETYEQKKKLAQKSLVDVTLYAGLGQKTNPLSFPVPYKVFLSQPPSGPLFFNTKKDLEEAISRYRARSVSFHCEDPEILERYQNAPTHEEQRPVEAETAGLEFALSLIEKYDLAGRICHLSSQEGLKKITQAKKRGLKVSAEVTPHHLFFDQSMITEQNHRRLQMNPPLRSGEDRQAMLQGLRQGEIDFLATDHAPHTLEEKAQGISGVPELDTYGPFVCWLMAEHGFTPQDIARVCAYNPGEFVNAFRGKDSGKGFGKIAEGYAGSLAILDLNSPWKIFRADLKTKCAWSPFENLTFPGRVAYTIVKGKVYQND